MSTNWISTFAEYCPQTQDDKTIVPSFLSADITLGQFGSVASNGTFIARGTIETMPAHGVPQPLGDIWSFSGGTTKSQQAGVSLEGKAIDPDSGTEVTVGNQVTWGFTESVSLSGQLSSVFHGSIDPLPALQENQEQITLVAKQYGYTSRGGVLKPDWVVITDVFVVIAGVIVGATTKDKTFSITGAASAVNNLLQGGVNAGWSFTSETVSDQLFYVIFPGKPVAMNADGSGIDPTTVGNPNTLYTIAFRAASIQGSEIVPWHR